jgi:Concanavalin A-like lectin/glucanases superfamily/Secretion system C-terminal sorting domain
MKFLLLIWTVFISTKSICQNEVHQYQFLNNLYPKNGIGPPLDPSLNTNGCVPTNGFFSSSLIPFDNGNCNGVVTTIYNYTKGGGLKYPNPANFVQNEYTIHIFFKFNSNASTNDYFRVIEFKGGSSDNGLYISGSNGTKCTFKGLTFANSELTLGPTLDFNKFYLITLVRRNTDAVSLYVNGQSAGFSFSDPNGIYIIPPTKPIILFDDDYVGQPCEEWDGKIKYFSVSPTASTPTQILELWTNLCVVVLPLNFTKFTAVATANITTLQWAIDNFKDLEYFDIEKSIDAVQYSKIGTVQPNSVNNYSFKELNNGDAKSYFRIKAVLKDGSVKYSEVRYISKQKNEDILIYPNPAISKLEIQVPQFYKYNRYEIIDAIGKVVLKNTINSIANNFDIKLSQLPVGIYSLKLISREKVLFKNFIKQ